MAERHRCSWISDDRRMASKASGDESVWLLSATRIWAYSLNKGATVERYGSGSIRPRKAAVPIAFASFSTADLRASKRDNAIEKVKPIINASSPIEGAARVERKRSASFAARPFRPR